MKTLSYEVIVNIAKFLSPPDLKSLSFCSKTYMPLCKDDFLFRILYERDFRKYAKDFFPLLANISSWKNLYTVLYVNKNHMIRVMKSHYGYKMVHVKNKKIFLVTINGEHDETEFPQTYLDHGYHEDSIIDSRKWLRFNPDLSKVLSIRHMNLAHQVYKLDQELGRRGDSPYLKGPPDGENIRFLSEGLAFWNEKTEAYNLVYPYSSIKEIFEECRDETTYSHNVKMEELREYFQQIISLTYNVQYNDAVAVVEESVLKNLFLEYDYDPFEHLCVGNTLSITCNRSPKWTYTDNMCIFHSNDYNSKKQEHIEINCKQAMVERGFCKEHNTAKNHHMKKYHRKQRQKLRNIEYINYESKSLPEFLKVKDFTLTQVTCEVLPI